MGRKLDIEQVRSTLEQTDEDRVYFRAGKFDIRVVHTDEGVVVDVYPWAEADGPGYTGDSLASTYAFDNEADEALNGDPDA